MRTPTRIPANVPARRALLAALAAVLLSVVVAPAVAQAAPGSRPRTETTQALRNQRQILIRQISVLTDQAARAQVRAGDADRRRFLSQAALNVVRRRFAVYAVDAYLDGVQDSEDEQLRRTAWAAALAEADRVELSELRAAKQAADADAAAADAATAASRRVAVTLDAARAALERTIADRTAYERALAASRARLRVVAAGVNGMSRHQRATLLQAELMRRYRFGPGGIPEGLTSTGEVLAGNASWYGPGFDGRATASGAIFDQEGWTVAHKTLPLGTILLITRGDRSVVVLVNDRGPFVAGRVLDLSHGVAVVLGTVRAGVAAVRAEVLVPA